MSESKSNDHGRYFEFLIVDMLQEKYVINLSDRAKKDQARDITKIESINESVVEKMKISGGKIVKWLNCELDLGNKTLLDRLPDREVGKQTHADITITDNNRKTICFSLKHNHEAIFHGRVLSCCNWLKLNEKNIQNNFENKKKELIKSLHQKIPVGTIFADNGIKYEYRDLWKNFIFEIHEEVINVLSLSNKNNLYMQNLFYTIVGQGANEFRILKKSNSSSVIIQDLTELKLPKFVNISNIQKKNKDSRSNYVWYLVLEFDNGIKIHARSKQDSGMMAGTPKIKHDWKVEDWGKSGMREKLL